MTKFAVFQIEFFTKISEEEFSKKYNSTNLQSKFNCEKILSLDAIETRKNELEDLSKISAHNLKNLNYEISKVNLNKLIANEYFHGENTRAFVFSDDASSSAFAFDYLQNEVTLKIFELTEKNVLEFSNALEMIGIAESRLNFFESVKQQCEGLSKIEFDNNLILLDEEAFDNIESEMDWIEESLDESKLLVESIFSKQWGG